jgi:hypothetical protein
MTRSQKTDHAPLKVAVGVAGSGRALREHCSFGSFHFD